MNLQQPLTSVSLRGALTLLSLILLPLAANAQSAFRLRNDTPMPIVVQVSSVFQGQVQRTRPLQLPPKGISPAVNYPGSRVISIYDARFPTRPVLQEPAPAGDDGLIVSVQIAPPPLKLKLVAIKPPEK